MLYAVINTVRCEVVDVYYFYPSVFPSSDCDVVSFLMIHVLNSLNFYLVRMVDLAFGGCCVLSMCSLTPQR